MGSGDGRFRFGTFHGEKKMSSSLDHKCQRCGSPYSGQICPFCTITGLDVNALLASEGLSMPPADVADGGAPPDGAVGEVILIDVVSNRSYPIAAALCRFGRDISNDIVLTGDKSLSRFHFQVTIVDNEYFVEDAGSRNGTFLNGAPVTAPKKLINGDIISAGMSRYRFVHGVDIGGGENPAGAGTAQSGEASGDMDMQPPSDGKSVDPLARIMQEGQALLGNSDDASDLDGFFDKAQDHDNNNNNGSDQNFMQLDRPSDAPIDELFQQQIRAAAAAKADEAAKCANNAPVDEAEQTGEHDKVQVAQNLHNGNDQAPSTTHCVANAAPRDWPEWCTNYTFPEIKDIKSKMEKLELEIKERQEQLAELESTVAKTDDVRNRILATGEAELVDACSEIFHLLKLDTAINGTTENEVVLSHEGRAVAIAKVVSTEAQPRPADLANLVSSLSTYWCDNGVEPKGILVVSMMQDGSPEDRPKFSKDIVDYAVKKNVCLISTVQLLAMFRDLTLRSADVESIRTEILGASGSLTGFEAVLSKK